MIQPRSADQKFDTRRPTPGVRRRRARSVVWLVLLTMTTGEAAASDEATLRVAVAPFAGDRGGEASSIARRLAARLARHAGSRVLAPGDFVADQAFDPRAADVRRWAYNAAVEAVVVGRVGSSADLSAQRGRVVEAVVRSGHSGAELTRFAVGLETAGGLDRAADALADSILEGLGFESPEQDAGEKGSVSPVTDENATPSNSGEEGGASASGGGLDANFSGSGFSSDAPIEIKADEAEIINRDSGRRLIFQRNVLVKQANVSLRSDRLEALYVKGDSEPRELRAEGRVAIDQGERHAKCDRAIYQREAHTLTCRGNAELVQGCDIVRGESIEFDLSGDQARIEGAASIVITPEDAPPAICLSGRG